MPGSHARPSASQAASAAPRRSKGEPLDWLGSEDPGYNRTEQRLVLARGLESLSTREREIVTLRFFGGLTQREIADRVGISQMHVSRLLAKSLARLRDELE